MPAWRGSRVESGKHPTFAHWTPTRQLEADSSISTGLQVAREDLEEVHLSTNEGWGM